MGHSGGDADSGRGFVCVEAGGSKYMGKLYFPLDFSVNLTLLPKEVY